MELVKGVHSLMDRQIENNEELDLAEVRVPVYDEAAVLTGCANR
jgi:hypothetical protein